MYSKKDQSNRTPIKICKKPGCKIKVKTSDFCGIHTKSKIKVRRESKNDHPKAKNEAKQAIQLYVRLRDANDQGYCKCVSCGKLVMWNRCDGGHYYPAEKSGTCFNELNIHAQCKMCNKRMQDPIINLRYTDTLIKRIGQNQFNDLKIKQNKSEKFDTWMLKEIRDNYILKANEEHKRIYKTDLKHKIIDKLGK